MSEAAAPPITRVPEWQSIPGLAHGFLGRRGGVSVGAYASLNLSLRLGDDQAAVAENRRRVEATLANGSRVVWMRQVHGERVAQVRSVTDDVGEADAMVTDQAGVMLAVLTADCVPILLLERCRRVAAVVHAGWRGTLAGLVTQAVAVLRATFEIEPAELEAALGPGIGGCCYEVDSEIGEQFSRRWGPLPVTAWTTYGSKGRLDLRSANTQLLRHTGLAGSRIYRVGPCTSCAADEYFSHRATGGRAGRQLSYVGWTV